MKMESIFILWYVLGCAGFIYWWTSEYDLTTQELAPLLVIGLSGPFSFLIGWRIHGDNKKIRNKTLIRKRR